MANDVNGLPGRTGLPIADKRERLFAGERERVVPYHEMHGSPYCLPAFIPYTSAEVAALRQASESVDRIYRKVLRFVQRTLPDSFLIQRLGIHPAVVPASRIEVPYHLLTRQDWLLGPSGPVWIENNTDTPSGVPESAFLAGSLMEDYAPDYGNPSSEMDVCLQRALADIVGYYRSLNMEGKLIFSSLDQHEHSEDAANTAYVMEQAKRAGLEAEFAPFGELEVVEGEGMYWRGERVGIWYRLYPLEFLAEDCDDEGFPIGEEVLRLVAEGKLGLINPAQSAITQSKGFMALLWSLAAEVDGISTASNAKGSAGTEADHAHTYPLTPDEAAFIRRYLPDTHWTPEPFIASRMAYVAKGMWGREGKGTELFAADGEPFHHEAEGKSLESNGVKIASVDEEREEDPEHYYGAQPKIYQRYVPMEPVSVELQGCSVSGWLLTGVYAIGGRYGGLLPRIGGRITGDLACFAPAAIIDKESEAL